MRLRFSYILAAMIAVGIGVWMLTGDIVVGGTADAARTTLPPSERIETAQANRFRVAIRHIKAGMQPQILEIRGRTEADARIDIQAETSARVIARAVEEGQYVKAGETLCVLDPGVRAARLKETRARFEQAMFDFKAAETLGSSGYASATRVSALKSAVDAADARLREAQLELDRTIMKAPVSGIIQTPLAEIGARLSVGSICARLIKADPMLAVGQVSERVVDQIQVGDIAEVTLINDQIVTGHLRFIAAAADPKTRTFRIEVTLANPDHKIRDGMSALTRITLAPRPAHNIAASALVLNDDGIVGVRLIDEEDRVKFQPVQVLGSDAQGTWVEGLPPTARLIVVGQNYVKHGQLTDPVVATKSVSEGKAVQ